MTGKRFLGCKIGWGADGLLTVYAFFRLESTSMQKLFHAFLFLFVCSLAWRAPAEDQILHCNIERTNVNLLIPQDLKTIHGVLIDPANEKVSSRNVWSESCRYWRMAEMGVMLENVDKRNNRPHTLKIVIEAALKQFSEESGHPELAAAPLLFGGMSKGGGWSAELGQTFADRTVAFNNVCGWVGRPGKDLSMPATIIIGGTPDGFKMLDAISTQYEPAQRRAPHGAWPCNGATPTTTANANFSLTWTHIPRGPRAVFAEYATTDGTHGVSNPVTVIASPRK